MSKAVESVRKENLSNVPMFAIGASILALTFGVYVVAIRAGYAGNAQTLFKAANIEWILSIVSSVTNAIFFVIRRQRRFILLIIIGIILMMSAAYIRNGGETTPLPYLTSHDNR